MISILDCHFEITGGKEDLKKDGPSKPTHPHEHVTNGNPAPRLPTTGGASVDLTTEIETIVTIGTLASLPIASDQNCVGKLTDALAPFPEEIVAEPLDKILENKLVKEKRMELDKKLENLRKKHEKKKITLQSQKSSGDGTEKRSKLINMKLVKRLSSKSM